MKMAVLFLLVLIAGTVFAAGCVNTQEPDSQDITPNESGVIREAESSWVNDSDTVEIGEII
jgi:hypothetical protein